MLQTHQPQRPQTSTNNTPKVKGLFVIDRSYFFMKKTTPAQLRAVKQYEQKVKKLQIVFNIKDNKDEAELIEAIEADKEPFSTLVKRLLKDYYRDKAE